MDNNGYYGQIEKRHHKNLKEMVNRGIIPVGVGISLPCPAIAEFAALAGYDFVSLDLEHGLYNLETVCNIIRTADSCGLATTARVADKDLILPLLDFGLVGVAVPHVRSAAQARELVERTKYKPVGRRGFNSSGRAHSYGKKPFVDCAAEAADEITLAVQIEDLEGLENVDEILAVPGIDYLQLGPGDLSADLGYPGNDKHPVVLAALKKILKTADKYGVKYFGNGAPISIVEDKSFLIRAFTEARVGIHDRARASFEADMKLMETL